MRVLLVDDINEQSEKVITQEFAKKLLEKYEDNLVNAHAASFDRLIQADNTLDSVVLNSYWSTISHALKAIRDNKSNYSPDVRRNLLPIAESVKDLRTPEEVIKKILVSETGQNIVKFFCDHYLKEDQEFQKKIMDFNKEILTAFNQISLLSKVYDIKKCSFTLPKKTAAELLHKFEDALKQTKGKIPHPDSVFVTNITLALNAIANGKNIFQDDKYSFNSLRYIKISIMIHGKHFFEEALETYLKNDIQLKISLQNFYKEISANFKIASELEDVFGGDDDKIQDEKESVQMMNQLSKFQPSPHSDAKGVGKFGAIATNGKSNSDQKNNDQKNQDDSPCLVM
jgi:hypothetical protein